MEDTYEKKPKVDRNKIPLPRVKRVNLLIQIRENNDPKKIADVVEAVIKELEDRKITATYSRSGVTADFDGKGED